MLFATNRPDLIDSALTRFGRIDAIIPFLLPKQQSRVGIVQAQVKVQKTDITKQAAALIAEKAIKYSAADIAAVISKARKLGRLRGLDYIDQDCADQALRQIKPASPQTADWYELLAINACNDSSLLPQEEATLMDDRAELQKKISAAKPIEVTRREERTE